MDKSITRVDRFVGLDVHAETIAVAVAEKDGEVGAWGQSSIDCRASESWWRS